LVVNVGDSNRLDFAQTFTVGATGTLTAFDIWVAKSPAVTLPLLYDIRRTQSDLPTEADTGANILVSGFNEAAGVPIEGRTFGPNAFLNIDLENPIGVTAGEVLAIVLRSDDPNPDRCCDIAYGWYGRSPGLYERGDSFTRNSFGLGRWSTESVIDADLAFRTFDTGAVNASAFNRRCYGVGMLLGLCTKKRHRSPA
jgi:hypothetical protein